MGLRKLMKRVSLKPVFLGVMAGLIVETWGKRSDEKDWRDGAQGAHKAALGGPRGPDHSNAR